MNLKPSPSFMRVIVLLAIFSLAPITLYILYARTGGPSSAKELTFQRNLKFLLMAGTDAIDLSALTPWPWVTVCAVGTGLSRDEFNALVGFAYRDYDELHWLPLDEYWTLVFIDSEREASWGLARPVTPIRISRKEVADLALPQGSKGQCLKRASMRVEVNRHQALVGESPAVMQLVDTEAD